MSLWKMAVLVAPLALAGSGPGQEKLFGNWAAVCDNVKRCSTTVLMPENWGGETAPGLTLTREAGPAGAVAVTITPVSEAPGIIDILIDRRLMGSGVMTQGAVHLTGGTAEGIARAMATGRVLSLRAQRKTLATISLGGSSAALRYIDSEQGRAGGVTALVARGPKSATTVPAAMALPRIQAIRPPKGKAATLPEAQIADLRKQAECDDRPMPEGFTPEFHRLDGRTTLAIIPCGMGAYQGWAALYVITGGKVAPAAFDIWNNDASPVPQLTGVEWDPAQGVLGSHGKGRGLGDCGIDQSYVWDGSRFRLTLYVGLNACRLSGDWMPRYRAIAAFK